ncbi:MAG: hypothetical protein C4562_06805 [Actinobacteria bacterium]|nr:MAG: hypothetical protein C4562_06805 [Actinomycetota bacterium]
MAIKVSNSNKTINSKGLHFSELNQKIRSAVKSGADKLKLVNVNGQRYIGTGIRKEMHFDVYGTAGADLGAFMDGPNITVHGNAQDAVGNTMNSGLITVDGHAGDVVGIAMRGGCVYIKGEVGYRAGIHMKEYEDQKPVLVIGGAAHDFLGEYMAGGVLIVLNYHPKPSPCLANYIGTGMHGGAIYLRGKVEQYQLGKEVSVVKITENDKKMLNKHLKAFAKTFKLDYNGIANASFTKLMPLSHRPYGQLYAY